VIAAHGGGPDWGNGPLGRGKLFQVRHAEAYMPQPVLAWAQGPDEVCVAFDLEPNKSEHFTLPSKPTIEFGRYVAAGDRFESLRPGYQVVHDQLMTPRFDLPVFGVRLVGGNVLSLATAVHPEAATYVVTLDGLGRPPRFPGGDELPQVAETDITYDLCGVEAVWRQREWTRSWSGWLPHFDLQVARELTRKSDMHDELWTLLRLGPRQHLGPGPGDLTLRTKLDLWQMLRPAVQPGARIDHQWPEERVTLVFRAASPLEVRTPQGTAAVKEDTGGKRTAEVMVQPREGEPVPVEVTLRLGEAPADLDVTFHTAEDARPRALPLRRLILPWAALRRESAAARVIPEIEGGNWSRGRAVYFGETAACSRCHDPPPGGGPRIGPDLSNLPHRDYASVLRDITEPSLAIHPDHVAQAVQLADGRTLTGAVRADGDRVHIADAQGQVTTVDRDEIQSLFPSATSIMPDGLLQKIGPEKLRDLMTFLLLEPPRMPDYGPAPPPPPRSRKEVEAVLAGTPEPPPATRPIHVALVAGRKDHGPGEHDYPAWQKAWTRLLSMAEDVKVTAPMDWPSPEELRSAAVLVFYQQGSWTPERARDIDAFLGRGGGIVHLHYAVDGGQDPSGFARRIGLAWQGGRSKFRHGPLDLVFTGGDRQPIARNFERVHFEDESYWDLVGAPGDIALMATGVEDGEPKPLLWTLEPGGGRVFVSILGHYSWTFDDPLFRTLILRAIAWAAREPVDRFNHLVTPGARVGE
jgi:putative heme-binding domain-containing protein